MMEPEEVLEKFLESINQTDYNFASNCALEWFGRTLRGKKSVHQYFRYNLAQQYEHHFNHASSCEPFEVKPIHFKTREKSKADELLIVEPCDRDSCFTPKPSTSRSNPISEDKTLQIKSKSIDDVKNEFITPPKNGTLQKTYQIDLQKTSNCCKTLNFDDNKDETEFKNVAPTMSTPKNTNGLNTEPIVHESISNANGSVLEKKVCHIDYSDLRYIEAIGTIRTISKSKHKGIKSTTTVSHNDLLSNSPDYYRNRKTKLKISYRIQNINKDVKFALIIYENITKNQQCRRNLLSEFTETVSAMPNKSSTRTKQNLKKSKSTNVQSPLKRLRF